MREWDPTLSNLDVKSRGQLTTCLSDFWGLPSKEDPRKVRAAELGGQDNQPMDRMVRERDGLPGVEACSPLGLPSTRGLEVDSRGFFNGDWLSLSFSVSA